MIFAYIYIIYIISLKAAIHITAKRKSKHLTWMRLFRGA